MSTQYVVVCKPTLSKNYKVRSFYLCCCIRCIIDYAESVCFLPRIGKENQIKWSQLQSYIHRLIIHDRGRVINLNNLSVLPTLITGSTLSSWHCSLLTSDISHSQAGVYCTQVDSSGPTKYILRSIQVDLKSGVCNRISLVEFSFYTRFWFFIALFGATGSTNLSRYLLH